VPTKCSAGVILLAASGCAVAAAGASANGGTSGGALYVPQPAISKVQCARRCGSHRRARAGSTIAIVGEAFDGARKVIFRGAAGRRDDLAIPARGVTSRRIRVKVPIGAVSGPVEVYVSRAAVSEPSKPLAILPPPPPAPNAELSRVPGVPSLETGTSRTKVFYGARRAVSFSYRLASAMQVKVELVNAADGSIAAAWDQGVVEAGQIKEIVWSGRGAPGRYSFRLTAQGQAGEVAQSAQADSTGLRDAFDLYDHIFPIRGRHDYGGGGGRFGAGRHGHSHQGQDVFAACGTPLVAARGGKVQYSGYHGAAGYYLVIDGAGTGADYAYMHLAQRSPFRKGDRVYTGQQLGAVGDSGNARGCHLHFETWTAPGWYQGGRPVDPLGFLQTWDGWS
jgi:murein DD-endopeptidase MepM/ murein hydrolase activator NlpD